MTETKITIGKCEGGKAVGSIDCYNKYLIFKFSLGHIL